MPETCFVISPIGKSDSPQRKRSNRLCDHILLDIFEKHNITVVRGDQIQSSGPITVQIVEAITDAKIVVADLVDPNPNVYYELGIAESFHKPIIRLGGGESEALPFDVRDMRTIHLPKQVDGGIDVSDATQCSKDIESLLPIMLEDDYKPVSIISLAERQAKFNKLTERVANSGNEHDLIIQELAHQVKDMRNEIKHLGAKEQVKRKGEWVVLGRGRPTLEKFISPLVSLDKISADLVLHPNHITLEDIEVQKLGGSYKLVIAGGYVDRMDGSEMQELWETLHETLAGTGIDIQLITVRF